MKLPKSQRRRLCSFILRTLLVYPSVGIVIGTAMFATLLWAFPNEASKAFGGDVWGNHEDLKLSWVGSVVVGIGAFSGLILGCSIAITRIASVLLNVVMKEGKEKTAPQD